MHLLVDSASVTYYGAFHFVDGADAETEYVYDANGNMTKDTKGRVIRNTFLTDVVSTYTMSQAERTKRLLHYDDLKNEVELRITDVHDAESANEAQEAFEEMEEVFDIRLYAKQLLYEKSVKLGLRWNRTESKYEAAKEK